MSDFAKLLLARQKAAAPRAAREARPAAVHGWAVKPHGVLTAKQKQAIELNYRTGLNQTVQTLRARYGAAAVLGAEVESPALEFFATLWQIRSGVPAGTDTARSQSSDAYWLEAARQRHTEAAEAAKLIPLATRIGVVVPLLVRLWQMEKARTPGGQCNDAHFDQEVARLMGPT